MKNTNVSTLKVDGCGATQCEMSQNFHPASSGEDVFRNGDGSSSRRCGSETARKIDRSITYMRQHLDKPLQASALAALVNVSPSHFFALFKHHTGSAPIDYFTRLRMQHACRLLDSTSSSVKEIADALGYNDPFYFSRVFKSVNRVAPSKYRDKQKQLPGGVGNCNESKFFLAAKKTETDTDHNGFAFHARTPIFNSANPEECVA